jgi:hypothetical protein
MTAVHRVALVLLVDVHGDVPNPGSWAEAAVRRHLSGVRLGLPALLDLPERQRGRDVEVVAVGIQTPRGGAAVRRSRRRGAAAGGGVMTRATVVIDGDVIDNVEWRWRDESEGVEVFNSPGSEESTRRIIAGCLRRWPDIVVVCQRRTIRTAAVDGGTWTFVGEWQDACLPEPDA